MVGCTSPSGRPGITPWAAVCSRCSWADLVFTERALIRWRSDFKTDCATRFCEVEGGLNQMTIRRFERLLAESAFRVERFETPPIKKARILHNRLTREFFTSFVRCALVPARGRS